MTAQQRLARLRTLVPAGGSRAARAPFVLLVVVLLGSGLLALLLLNASLNNGSFELEELERKNKELSDEQQALEQEVGSYSAPEALEQRARELGMVPGGVPAFLTPEGKVRGEAEPAPSPTSAPPDSPGAAEAGAAEPGAAEESAAEPGAEPSAPVPAPASQIPAAPQDAVADPAAPGPGEGEG